MRPHLDGVRRSPAYAASISATASMPRPNATLNARAISTHTAALELRPFLTGRVVLWLTILRPRRARARLVRSARGASVTMCRHVPATWLQNPPSDASRASAAGSSRANRRSRRTPRSSVDANSSVEPGASAVTVACSPASPVPSTRHLPVGTSGFSLRKPPAQSLCSPRRHRRPHTKSSWEGGEPPEGPERDSRRVIARESGAAPGVNEIATRRDGSREDYRSSAADDENPG